MSHGMNAETGKRLTGIELLKQDISRALLTPVNTCVLNRDFGSLTFDIIDHPGNPGNLLKLYSSCVDAILRFVPGMVPTRIQTQPSDTKNGNFNLLITGIVTDNIDNINAGSSINLTIPLIDKSVTSQ